jgi:hypothetical protein
MGVSLEGGLQLASPGWTAEELALLGTVPDAEVAARIERTEGAVTLKRCRLLFQSRIPGRKQRSFYRLLRREPAPQPAL